MASVTSPAGEEELVVLYEITVRVGKQELAGARRRYREFHKLHHVLSENYPHLLADASSSSYDPHDEGAGIAERDAAAAAHVERLGRTAALPAQAPLPRRLGPRRRHRAGHQTKRVAGGRHRQASIRLARARRLPERAALRGDPAALGRLAGAPHRRTALVPQRSPQPPAQRGETPSVIFLIAPPFTHSLSPRYYRTTT